MRNNPSTKRKFAKLLAQFEGAVADHAMSETPEELDGNKKIMLIRRQQLLDFLGITELSE